MKKIDFYEIAIKLMGLYLTVVLIGQLRDVLLYTSLLVQSKNNPDSFNGLNQIPTFLVVLFCFLALAVFTALLLFKTKAVAKIICSKTDFEESVTLFVNKKSTYESTLLLVGLVTIMLTLPDFVMHLKNYVQAINNFSVNPIDRNFFITDGLKITLGVLAVCYAKPLSAYFEKDSRFSRSNHPPL